MHAKHFLAATIVEIQRNQRLNIDSRCAVRPVLTSKCKSLTHHELFPNDWRLTFSAEKVLGTVAMFPLKFEDEGECLAPSITLTNH